MNIFELIDKNSKKVYLTKERWSHIKQGHPNVPNAEEIKETISNPTKLIQEEDILIYYRYFKHRKEASKYMKVIVKYLNGTGFVITAYFVRNVT